MRAVPLALPDPCLVVLCGPAAAGKSSFAARWFAPTEIVSSDALRGMLGDDPDRQDINEQTFEVLHRVVEIRLALGRTTVVDATNLETDARAALRRIARSQRLPAHLVVFRADPATLRARNQERDRRVPNSVLGQHLMLLSGLDGAMSKERWDGLHEVDAAALDLISVERVPLAPIRVDERGPFDIVGDVHGCLDLLDRLIAELGYDADGKHPDGRRLVFVGDLVDRGPSSVGVLRRVLPWLEDGTALWVPGNHDDKLWRWLQGRAVNATGVLRTTIDEWERLGDTEDRALRARFDRVMVDAPPYLLLDGGQLLVSHAGLEEKDHGRVGPGIRAFCLYGKTTGKEVDGYPERLDWAGEYAGAPAVVYGHVPVRQAVWRNNTVDIDLGAVFGGALCAVRWPERTFVTIPAETSWVEGTRWETWT